MKIACIIQGNAPTLYFANAVHRRFPLDLTIVNRRRRVAAAAPSKPAVRRAAGLLRQHGLVQGGRVIGAKVFRRIQGRFSPARDIPQASPQEPSPPPSRDPWEALGEGMPVLEVENSNASAVREGLSELKPDVLLIHGGPIVKDDIVALAGCALNLHWGLSPYYRGSRCTEWALINWDPLNIGVTIHVPNREVDGGPIVAQARATVKPDDTAASIDNRLTLLGTELVIEILQRISEGWSPQPQAQTHSHGLVNTNRQWTELLHRQARFIERNDQIAEMLRRPARSELPIITLP